MIRIHIREAGGEQRQIGQLFFGKISGIKEQAKIKNALRICRIKSKRSSGKHLFLLRILLRFFSKILSGKNGKTGKSLLAVLLVLVLKERFLFSPDSLQLIRMEGRLLLCKFLGKLRCILFRKPRFREQFHKRRVPVSYKIFLQKGFKIPLFHILLQFFKIALHFQILPRFPVIKPGIQHFQAVNKSLRCTAVIRLFIFESIMMNCGKNALMVQSLL